MFLGVQDLNTAKTIYCNVAGTPSGGKVFLPRVSCMTWRKLVCGLWLWSAVYGTWLVVFVLFRGVWSVPCGEWSVVCGVWYVVCGLLSVVCGW